MRTRFHFNQVFMRNFLQFVVFGLILLLAACTRQTTTITSLKDLEGGKTFAVPTGTVADQFVLDKFPDAKIKYFNSVLDCALAVKEGKADGAVYDKPILKNIAAKNDGLAVLDELILDDKYGFAVQIEAFELKTVVDGVLAELKANGTYNDMMKRWFPEKGSPASMPDVKLDGTNGVFRFGTAAVTEPMSFVDGNRKVVGFDIEFASYVAQKLGKQIEIVDMEFGAMLPALIAGKVDMIGAGISITEERAKKVLFSESYYPSGIAVIVKSNTIQAEAIPSSAKMKSIDDIAEKKIGVLMGSIHDSYATKNYTKATISQYQNAPDMLTALNVGKIDVAFNDDASLPEVFKAYPNFGILVKNLFFADIAAGFNDSNDNLREQFNAFLKEIKANGVYDDIYSRWIEKGIDEMPEIKSANNNGELKVGVVGDLGMPTTLIKNGEYVGFDLEIAKRFAASLGKKFVPIDMPFGSLIASISTNKIDMITASMMITEEREKQIDFSDPYFKSGISVFAKKENIENTQSGKLAKLDDIADKKVGIFSGTVHDAFMAQKYPKAEVFQYDGTADMILALKTGKIDAAMFDAITAGLFLKHNSDLGLLTNEVFDMPLGVGFNKNNPELRKEFNAFLKEIRKNGAYDEMNKRWFVDDAEEAVMPEFKNGSGKKLVAAVSVEDLPYVAYMGGRYVGFDVEMIYRFAEWGNYNLEINTINFPSLIAALGSGKADLISDGIGISEERAKQIDFSDSYAVFRTAVIAQKRNLASFSNEEPKPIKTSFFKSVSNSFYSNIILENRYLLILDGLKITVIISILAALFGTLVGGLICFMKMSKNKLVSLIANLYISLIRGTPVLVLLMIIFYVIFASVNINPVIVAVIAFGINFGAYVSEMFRTSIESVDKGQREAGIAGGFTKVQTFINIIMPQAVRQVLPVYKGEFISLLKMTSIVGYIAVQDLTKASDIIRSRTFDAFFPLIMAAVLYIVLAGLLTWALSYVEISVDPKRKRIKKGMEVEL
jgi:polar amino acid transport system substrate-binding protein